MQNCKAKDPYGEDESSDKKPPDQSGPASRISDIADMFTQVQLKWKVDVR